MGSAVTSRAAGAEAPRLIRTSRGRARVYLLPWSGEHPHLVERLLYQVPGVQRARVNGLTVRRLDFNGFFLRRFLRLSEGETESEEESQAQKNNSQFSHSLRGS